MRLDYSDTKIIQIFLLPTDSVILDHVEYHTILFPIIAFYFIKLYDRRLFIGKEIFE
jgi:hypothetical protein